MNPLAKRHPDRSLRTLPLALFAWLCLVLLGATSDPNQDIDAEKMAKVQAAYLYNFTKYVRWPAESFERDESPIVIGVLGQDPFGKVLDKTIEDKQVGRHPLVIRRLPSTEKPETVDAFVQRCHVLFISDIRFKDLMTILDTAREHDVLTVSSLPGFAHRGGMIGFVLEDNRIIFEINRESVRKTNLKISSKLLKLARIVPGEKPARKETP